MSHTVTWCFKTKFQRCLPFKMHSYPHHKNRKPLLNHTFKYSPAVVEAASSNFLPLGGELLLKVGRHHSC